MVDYDKVGLLTIRDGKVLLCRKARARSTSLLILPGGCREPGESAMDCLRREIREELGEVRLGPVEFVGVYSDKAAGSDPDHVKTVRIELYRGEVIGEPAPHSEIAELVWFGEADDWRQLAPSIANKILPDLLRRGVLPWPSGRATQTFAR